MKHHFGSNIKPVLRILYPISFQIDYWQTVRYDYSIFLELTRADFSFSDLFTCVTLSGLACEALSNIGYIFSGMGYEYDRINSFLNSIGGDVLWPDGQIGH